MVAPPKKSQAVPLSQSGKLYARAKELMPAGVNSPVRAFRSVGGTPIYMESGSGAYVTDVDGKTYLDFCNSWGPLILGHCHEEVKAAINAVVAKGWTFGTPVEEEVKLAELVCSHLPELELIRFVNSGTEAVMSAVRLARAFTGRDQILKFSGCYHGHADYLLIEGGSGLATLGKPSSAGVPVAFAELTSNIPLNAYAKLQRYFEEHGNKLACVLMEGVPANNGLLVQNRDYIHLLRHLCDQYGAMLIFDEVLSGFRVPNDMAYKMYDVKPDLVTLGKVVGGGMPVGAYGGRHEIMRQVAPLGPVYQAGTLSGNPVAMAAGYATLQVYYQQNVPEKIARIGAHLDQRMNALVEPDRLGFVRVGSLFWLYFHRTEAPKAAAEIEEKSAETYAGLHKFMLECGVYLAPSAYEVGFLNAAMSIEDMDRFADTVARAKEQGIL